MYRCTECNAEYETKPQYCDCGNNIFEEIKVSEKEVSSLNSEINQSQPKGHVIEEKEDFSKDVWNMFFRCQMRGY